MSTDTNSHIHPPFLHSVLEQTHAKPIPSVPGFPNHSYFISFYNLNTCVCVCVCVF